MSMEHENCPYMETYLLNRAVALIEGKWRMQILCSLYNNGPTCYDQSKEALDGVSNAVSANTLRKLERDGLVHWQEYLEAPIRMKHAITEPCRQPILILDALGDWNTTF